MHTNVTRTSDLSRKIQMSRHASKRTQQRGIPASCVPLIIAYGTRQYDACGGVRYLMSEAAMQKLRSAVGRTAQLERLQGCYLVVSAQDETVITAGHRYH